MGAYEPREDGRYHAGTHHDLRLAPGKVTQLGPGFHPCNGQRSGLPSMNMHQIWVMIHWYCSPNHGTWTTPTCLLSVHRHPCTTRDVSGKLFLCHLPWGTETDFLSLKATWDHRCRVQRWRVRHQVTWVWGCLWVSTDPTYGRYGQIPSALRQFWTVLATLADGVSQWSQL